MLVVQQPTDVPTNAPDHCPGTESDLAGKVDACEGCPNQDICASGQAKSTTQDPTTIPMINERLAGVKRKILVLSGKGGVGKSTFTSQLGWALAADEDVQVIFLSPHFIYVHFVSCNDKTADSRTIPFRYPVRPVLSLATPFALYEYDPHALFQMLFPSSTPCSGSNQIKSNLIPIQLSFPAFLTI